MNKNFLALSLVILLISGCSTLNKVIYKDHNAYVGCQYDKKNANLTVYGGFGLMKTDKSQEGTINVSFNYNPKLNGDKILMRISTFEVKGRYFGNNYEVRLLIDGEPVQYKGKETIAMEKVVVQFLMTKHTDIWSEYFDIKLSKREFDVLSHAKRIDILQLGDKKRNQIPFAFSGANVATINKFGEAVDNYNYYISQVKK